MTLTRQLKEVSRSTIWFAFYSVSLVHIIMIVHMNICWCKSAA